MKISRVVTGAVLFANLISTAIAQNTGNQSITGDLTLVGTAALTGPGVDSRTLPESHGRRPPDVGLPPLRVSRAGGLKVPTAPGSSAIDHASGFGFPGLTHLDQWSAGTGIYANSQFSVEPPDQGLAVGNGFVLEAVNTALAVYDQRGKLLKGPTALNQFFRLQPEVDATTSVAGDFTTDPDCYFDQQTQRFFITLAQVDPPDPNTGLFGPRAHILIAVSKTNDPTQGFNLFRIDATDDGKSGTPFHAACPCFADQPHVGADANGFYISTNEFNIDTLNPLSTSVFTGAQIYAMSKNRLINGEKLSTLVHFVPELSQPDLSYAIVPSKSLRLQQSDDDSGKGDDDSGQGPKGVEYFLSTPDITNPLDNRLAVWAITNTRSLSSSKPDLKLTKVIVATEVYGPPPSADQKFGPTPFRDFLAGPQAPTESFCIQAVEPLEKLHTNNDRIQQVVFADGKLWGGLNTVVEQQSRQQRAGIAFFSVVPSWTGGTLKANIARQGYLSVSGNDVLNPAISVDNSGNAAIVFTLAGPEFFPSAAFANLEDQSKIHVLAPGNAPEDGFTGYDACTPNAMGIARWGDYSGATTDESGNIWIATEFIPAPSSGIPGTGTFYAHWGTFIAKVAGSSDD